MRSRRHHTTTRPRHERRSWHKQIILLVCSNSRTNLGLKMNIKGADMLAVLQMHNMYVATSHFKHKTYATWISFSEETSKHQLDNWLTNSLKIIQDAKVKILGVVSNHGAVLLKVELKIKKKERKSEKSYLCYKMLQDKETRQIFNEHNKHILGKDTHTTWSTLASEIKKASERTISTKSSCLQEWFEPKKGPCTTNQATQQNSNHCPE